MVCILMCWMLGSVMRACDGVLGLLVLRGGIGCGVEYKVGVGVNLEYWNEGAKEIARAAEIA